MSRIPAQADQDVEEPAQTKLATSHRVGPEQLAGGEQGNHCGMIEQHATELPGLNMQASWVIGASGRPRDENALPCTEWACAAATTSGRAAWTAAWITNAARFTGRRPVPP